MFSKLRRRSLVSGAIICGLAVAGAGCHRNADKLAAAQAELDRQLVEKKELADNLNEHRREMDLLELREQEALTELKDDPAARAEFEAASAPVFSGPVTTFPTLPPESPWEGEEGRRRRVQIFETERRLAELDKVLGEMNRVNVRRRELKAKLMVLDRIRKRSADGGGPR